MLARCGGHKVVMSVYLSLHSSVLLSFFPETWCWSLYLTPYINLMFNNPIFVVCTLKIKDNIINDDSLKNDGHFKNGNNSSDLIKLPTYDGSGGL